MFRKRWLFRVFAAAAVFLATSAVDPTKSYATCEHRVCDFSDDCRGCGPPSDDGGSDYTWGSSVLWWYGFLGGGSGPGGTYADGDSFCMDCESAICFIAEYGFATCTQVGSGNINSCRGTGRGCTTL